MVADLRPRSSSGLEGDGAGPETRFRQCSGWRVVPLPSRELRASTGLRARGYAAGAAAQPAVIWCLEPLLPFARFRETVAGQCARDLRARRAHPGADGSGMRSPPEPGRKRPTPSGRDLAYLALNLISAGDASGGREALRQALRRANREYVREDLIANAFMRLGDRESAIHWLVKGAASNVGGINFSLEDSLYAPIRSDPRIQAIIERLKVRWARWRAGVASCERRDAA